MTDRSRLLIARSNISRTSCSLLLAPIARSALGGVPGIRGEAVSRIETWELIGQIVDDRPPQVLPGFELIEDGGQLRQRAHTRHMALDPAGGSQIDELPHVLH